MTPLSDRKLFAKTVGAARGAMDAPYDKKRNFAKLIGTSVPTLTRLEEGAVGTVGDESKRREWARRIVEKSGASAVWFGLSPESGSNGELEPRLQEVEAVLREGAQVGDQLASAVESQGALIEEMLVRITRLERGQEGSGT